jgi:hypothetical protein
VIDHRASGGTGYQPNEIDWHEHQNLIHPDDNSVAQLLAQAVA